MREIAAPSPSSHCKFLGSVYASEYGGDSMGSAYNGALNQIRNQVAAKGGNAYVLTSKPSYTFLSDVHATADAYSCPGS